MIYFILIAYIAFTFWGSLLGSKGKDQSPESYFLADRSLGTTALFFTILATNFSAFYFLGFAGEGYKIGFAHYVMMSLGTAFAAVSFIVIGSRVWRMGKREGYITPGDLILGQTRSPWLARIFSGVMILFTLPYLALQIVGGGYILENLTGGEISYSLGIVLLTLVTISYVVLGGMHSVAKTDFKQGILIILLMLLAVAAVGHALGGFLPASESALAAETSLFSIRGVDGYFDWKKWFSYLVFWFFCIPMFPQLFMRFYIAKEVKFLHRSAVMYAFIPLIIAIFPVIIGVWGHVSFPGLAGKEADQILPMMLVEHTPPWLYACVMTGAIAAFMSTLDSQLLALSTMITRDFILPITKMKVSLTKEVWMGRLVVAALAAIGLFMAFYPFGTLFDMGKMAFSGLAVLFPTAFFVLTGRLKAPIFAALGILVSLFCLILFYYNVIPAGLAFGFEPFIICILISFVIHLPGIHYTALQKSGA